MSKLRILVLSLNFAPEQTATGKYTGEMAAWLAARGHDVHAIAAFPHYPQWRIEERYRGRGWFVEQCDGVTVYRTPLFVPPMEKLGARNRILMECTFSAAAAWWWLTKVLFARRFDVVIGVCPPLQNAVMPWLYRMLRGVPFVFHVQDFQVDAALDLGMLASNKGLRSALLGAESFLLKRATRASTITEAMRARLLAKGVPAASASLFPNWADISFVRPRARNNPLRTRLGAGDDDTLVVHAGNMGEKQGLEVMLEAADLLKDQSHLKFVLVGQGARRGWLEAEVQRRGLVNLRFFDVFPWDDVPDMLAAGDIHLVIQRREAGDLVMPSKMTNILAAGRPTIATAEPGTALADVLTAHGAGQACEPDNAQALAAAIVALAADPSARAQMGQNARRYAEEFIAKDAILGAFEKDLCELAQKRGRP